MRVRRTYMFNKRFNRISRIWRRRKKRIKRWYQWIWLELSKRIDIRKMPQISFHYDNSYEYGQNIDKLIEELHKEEE